MWSMTRKRRAKKRLTRRRQYGGANGLTVHFHNSRKNANLTSKKLLLSDVQEEPQVSWSKQPGPVTFICWDPDAPSPQNPSGYLHWFACDQTGTTPTTAAWSWTPPAPPHGFPHHYFFGIFKQTDGHVVQIPKARAPFDLEAFATENKLSLLEKVGFITETTSWFA